MRKIDVQALHQKAVLHINRRRELDAAQQFLKQNRERLEKTMEGRVLIEAAEKNVMSLNREIQEISIELKEAERGFVKALELIPNQQVREWMTMHFLRGLTWGEIGSIVGAAPANVSATVYRTVAKVQDRDNPIFEMSRKRRGEDHDRSQSR